MKKNKMMRIASVLLVAVLLSTCAISGTYAKYITTATGSDTARVAKWDVKLEENTMSNTFNFDLFKTVNDSDGNYENDVKPGTGDDHIIAPGTSGSFTINLSNASEVNAKYSIDYTLTNANDIPVEFSVDGTNWYSDINYLDVSGVALDMTGAASTAAITVQWHWIFEQGRDEADTALGTNGTYTLDVAAKVTVEQVD